MLVCLRKRNNGKSKDFLVCIIHTKYKDDIKGPLKDTAKGRYHSSTSISLTTEFNYALRRFSVISEKRKNKHGSVCMPFNLKELLAASFASYNILLILKCSTQSLNSK